MRSLIMIIAATLTTPALFACDQSFEAPTTTQGASSVSGPGYDDTSIDPLFMATCHGAYREAAELIDGKRIQSAICLQDSDCTIAVAETTCTGEIPAAINIDAEYAFLGFATRVEARTCSRLPEECELPAAGDAAPLGVQCLSNRCTIVEE